VKGIVRDGVEVTGLNIAPKASTVVFKARRGR
jgi:hypothetical protein